LLAASPAFANTGSIYWDDLANVGAGHDPFFGGITPSSCCNVGVARTVMPHLTTGDYNTALGDTALSLDTSGDGNTATGKQALLANDTGSFNTAAGVSALELNKSGESNVATGYSALEANTIGNENVATGRYALFVNTTGSFNLALGTNAGQNLTTGSNNIDIANGGKAGESAAIRIGTKGTQKKAFLAGVSGKSISGPAQPVLVNAQGQLGTASAASAGKTASSTDRKLSHLQAAVKRLQRENRRQGKQIRALRSVNG
jgi:hypothetical protein